MCVPLDDIPEDKELVDFGNHKRETEYLRMLLLPFLFLAQWALPQADDSSPKALPIYLLLLMMGAFTATTATYRHVLGEGGCILLDFVPDLTWAAAIVLRQIDTADSVVLQLLTASMLLQTFVTVALQCWQVRRTLLRRERQLRSEMDSQHIYFEALASV